MRPELRDLPGLLDGWDEHARRAYREHRDMLAATGVLIPPRAGLETDPRTLILYGGDGITFLRQDSGYEIDYWVTLPWQTITDPDQARQDIQDRAVSERARIAAHRARHDARDRETYLALKARFEGADDV